MTNDDEGVGYGRPPRHSQFKPGQSGNPRGRPRKGASVEDLIERELDQPITITENGRKKKVRKREAWAKSFVNGLMRGGAVGNNRIYFEMAARRRESEELREYERQMAEEENAPTIVTMELGDPETQFKITQASYFRMLRERGEEPPA